VLHCYTAQSLGNDINRYLAAGWFLIEGLVAFNCESGSGANFIATMGMPADAPSAPGAHSTTGRLRAALAMLREIEWGPLEQCTHCGGRQRTGHDPDCKLKELIG